jgi:threonylcarbamoyladenosine tRNA methylthiotransferase MtaB
MCDYIIKKSPLASISTDYIVGFLSETNAQFENSILNLKLLPLCNMHIFPFSLKKDTKAENIKNIVSDSERKRRFLEIDKINKDKKQKYLKNFISKEVEVIFEKSEDKNLQKGHSQYFFSVKVKTKKNLHNKLLKVKITKLVNNEPYGVLV